MRADQLFRVDLQFDRGIERQALAGQHLVERLGLLHGARKAVEDETVLRVGLVDAVIDDADHDLVGDERAGLHHRLGLQPDRRLRLDGGAQHVAGRELRNAVLLGEPRRLRAFAGAGRPEQYQPHLFLPLSFALRIRPSY